MQTRFRNHDDIALSPARSAALAIASAGLDAIDTTAVMERSLQRDQHMVYVGDDSYDLSGFDNVYVIGIGKCALEAARYAETVLADVLTDGVVISVGGSSGDLNTLRYFEGTHPMPSEQNVEAAQAVIETLQATTERDVVICLISGGGSTLLCLPEEGSTCIEEEAMISTLYEKGAPIQEINTLRKHTSLARGGHLAAYAYPATVTSLIFSDIPGGDITHVASGPTIKDETTVADADHILEKYDLLNTCQLDHCGLVETPKEEKYFDRVANYCVVSNIDALEAMKRMAQEYGLSACICSSCLTGEARDVGQEVVQEAVTSTAYGARLYGGETTVTVHGDGKGGRNQELALAALEHITSDTLIMTLASDGRDNSDAAGAIADPITRDHASDHEVSIDDHLARNDSYTFFQKTGDALHTGRTGANVADLLIALRTDMIE